MDTNRVFSQEEIDILRHHQKFGVDPYLRERCLILILRYLDGRTLEDIAALLNISYRTVAHWSVHGDPSNISEMRDKRRDKRNRKATVEYNELLCLLVKYNPNDLGFEFERWTGGRLAEEMEKLTGIALSASQIRQNLKKKNEKFPIPYRKKKRRVDVKTLLNMAGIVQEREKQTEQVLPETPVAA